jgi:hypothetical protein
MHVTIPEGEGISLPHMECYKTGELTPQEALLATQWLGLGHVILSHFVDPACRDVMVFRQLAESQNSQMGRSLKVTVLKPGETIQL